MRHDKVAKKILRKEGESLIHTMSSNKEWLDIFAIFCSKPFLFYEGFFFLRETDYEYDSKACLENQSDNFNLHNNNHKLSPKIQ